MASFGRMMANPGEGREQRDECEICDMTDSHGSETDPHDNGIKHARESTVAEFDARLKPSPDADLVSESQMHGVEVVKTDENRSTMSMVA